MLGSLVKKLRMLGIDTAYLGDALDSELKYMVRSQGRVLLTRDTALAGQLGQKALLVTGSDTREEFLSIAPSLGKSGCRPRPMSRCLRCNGQLVAVDQAAARAKVPPYVIESGMDLKSCPDCGKIYWKGTHAGRMAEEIKWMEEQLQRGRSAED